MSCSTGPLLKKSEQEPSYLYEQICLKKPYQDMKGMKGSIWLKAQSKEASGQFPAQVRAEFPDHLVLEVINLLGGREALIRVDGKKYTIDAPTSKKIKGSEHWGGIPLRWATALFLGQYPCPKESTAAPIEMTLTKDFVLQIQVTHEKQTERYRYSFRRWAGRPWVEKMEWEVKTPSKTHSVSFRFDDPDESLSGFPKLWEAQSAMGSVKVRWKEREPLR